MPSALAIFVPDCDVRLYHYGVIWHEKNTIKYRAKIGQGFNVFLNLLTCQTITLYRFKVQSGFIMVQCIFEPANLSDDNLVSVQGSTVQCIFEPANLLDHHTVWDATQSFDC
jgi:hypothetical protein